MISKLIYQTPSIQMVGSFEAMTRGQGTGLHFDGSFVLGQPVPFDPSGNPLIFS